MSVSIQGYVSPVPAVLFLELAVASSASAGGGFEWS